MHDVLASTDHTVARNTIRAERAGRQLQLNLVHVIHADDGKATEIWTQASDPAAAAGFCPSALLRRAAPASDTGLPGPAATQISLLCATTDMAELNSAAVHIGGSRSRRGSSP